MSYRIEYLTRDGGTIVEYTDKNGFARLQDEEASGYIEIQNHSRYNSVRNSK